eukprot:TRINITY_DN54141_c0_g1_i1.p1 TRINITY_DN54141_c0_g1~~TRINITY_DN54141_c0_g1_i1.p1  ORF type:complete len:136 (+),score=18.27 TRINITY_DN54141_c0_g1_i1:25-408(+)
MANLRSAHLTCIFVTAGGLGLLVGCLLRNVWLRVFAAVGGSLIGYASMRLARCRRLVPTSKVCSVCNVGSLVTPIQVPSCLVVETHSGLLSPKLSLADALSADAKHRTSSDLSSLSSLLDSGDSDEA